MVRDVHAFEPEPNTKGDAEHKGKVFIGVMGCSPLREGIKAKFSGLEYRPGVREVV
jgi:regulation of enolase protein 1 (concanavalin A-like superfamily)